MRRTIAGGIVTIALIGTAWGQQSVSAPPAPPQCVEENARTVPAFNRLSNLTSENVILQGRIAKMQEELKALQAKGNGKADPPADPPQPDPPPPPADPEPKP